MRRFAFAFLNPLRICPSAKTFRSFAFRNFTFKPFLISCDPLNRRDARQICHTARVQKVQMRPISTSRHRDFRTIVWPNIVAPQLAFWKDHAEILSLWHIIIVYTRYSEIISLQNLQLSLVIPWKRLSGRKLLKNYKINYQGVIFVVISCPTERGESLKLNFWPPGSL